MNLRRLWEGTAAVVVATVAIVGTRAVILSANTRESSDRVQTKIQTNSAIPKSFSDSELVQIKSTRFDHSQPAYFFKASTANRPLVVSLHTWGGNYSQEDFLAQVAKEHDWNYLHPDYGGPQWLPGACCYPEAVQDIDDAVAYGLKEAKADPKRIAIIGKSGGGTGVLAAYLQSVYSEAWYFAWAPIPDIISWHQEVQKDAELRKRYLDHILIATKSTSEFNISEAKLRSPYYFNFVEAKYPLQKKLHIYLGVRDGLDGWSTSITQPLLFYNKLLAKLSDVPRESLVDPQELDHLVSSRSQIQEGELGHIGDRRIVHRERYENIALYVFDGGHEIINARAVEDLKESFN